jgi:hypothetical protein
MDLEARLDRLERIEAAKVATVRYARACDAKDVTLLRDEVFTPDVVLHVPGAEHRGATDVAAFFQAAFDAEPGTRRHFLTNSVAEVTDHGEVELDAYFLFFSADRESVLGWGAYRDVIVVHDGRGRIREKTIVLDVHTTIDGGWAAGS